MIVADTGAIIALLDADDRHHQRLREVFEADRDAWVLPWAILPEVDYLAASRLGAHVQQAFVNDLDSGAFVVEWGRASDIVRANELCERYSSLRPGLVDTVVMAVTERLGASAIATLDLKHFSVIGMRHQPRLLPRDLE